MSDSLPDKVAQTAERVENWRKILSPGWLIFMAFATLAFGFGQFWSQYQENAQHGSPGVQALMQAQTDTLAKYMANQGEINARQQATNDRLTNLIESQAKLQAMQYEEMDRRLQRIEDGKR